jgi:hypothetical protein
MLWGQDLLKEARDKSLEKTGHESAEYYQEQAEAAEAKARDEEKKRAAERKQARPPSLRASAS